MDEQQAIIRGTYSDFKHIKTRGVLQIVIEIPIEHAPDFFAKFGCATSGNEKWVAIAALNKPLDGGITPDREHAADGRIRLSAMAAILAKREAFWRYLDERHGLSVPDERSADVEIKRICGIDSKRELDRNESAAIKFRNIKADFDGWMIDP